MKNKAKAFIVPFLLASLALTACGSNEKYDSSTAHNGINADRYDDYSYNDEFAEESVESPDSAPGSDTDPESSIREMKNETSDKLIEKEMLVYRCNIVVDVLDFDTAIGTFKENIEGYGAFVETENYTDGGTGNRWLYDNEVKWKTYTATVRVPSADYNNFCDATADLGDLRSKNANVENLSREYSDLSVELEIREAEEKRYLDLLAQTSDESYALTIEEKLTRVQIEIAQLKTRMNEIRTDVAYSYVNVTINEVKEYVEAPKEPEKTDTFLQRLSVTAKRSASIFLSFMEGLLFIMIYLLPYALIIALFVVVIVLLTKRSQKKKRAKYMARDTAETTPRNDNTKKTE